MSQHQQELNTKIVNITIPRASKVKDYIFPVKIKVRNLSRYLTGEAFKNKSRGIEILSEDLFSHYGYSGEKDDYCITRGDSNISVISNSNNNCCIVKNIYELKNIFSFSNFKNISATFDIIVLNDVNNFTKLLLYIKKHKYKKICIALYKNDIVNETIIKTIEHLQKTKLERI